MPIPCFKEPDSNPPTCGVHGTTLQPTPTSEINPATRFYVCMASGQRVSVRQNAKPNERFFFRISIEFTCPDCGETHHKVAGAEQEADDPNAMAAAAQTIPLQCAKTNALLRQAVRRIIKVQRITEAELISMQLPRRESIHVSKLSG